MTRPALLVIDIQNAFLPEIHEREREAGLRMIERRLKDYEVVVPKRKTPYGAAEVFYRSPGGHIVGFAQQNPD